MNINNIKPLILALGIASLTAIPTASEAGGISSKIVVNEFYRGGDLANGDEWAEIVLLEDLTAAELNGFFVGDSTGSTASKFASYQFTTMETIAANFCAGTIISVGGTAGVATEDTAYDPANGDWSIALQTAGSFLTGNGSTGNFAGTDVVYVDTDGTQGNTTISADGFAVNWDSTPGTFGANANVTISGPANNTGIFNTDSVFSADVAGSWSGGTLTQSAANGGQNTSSIMVLQDPFGTVTITGTPSLDEGDVGNTAFNFTVTRSNSCLAGSMFYNVSGFSANQADAADFGGTFPSGVVNFAAGESSMTLTINVSGDTDVESDEGFIVELSDAPNRGINIYDTDTGTIQNDDVLVVPNISIDDVTLAEGDAGITAFDFTVSIDASADVSVQVDTSDGSATTTNSDYAAITALMVNFTSGGATTQTVTVDVNGDTTVEPNETFNVNLSNATGGVITDGLGVGTINNDDAATLSIDDVTLAEGDSGTTSFNFTVSLDQSVNASVDVSTSDGSATTANNDYVAVNNQTVNFTAGGATTQVVTVNVNGDTFIEGNETFSVNLSNESGAVLGANSTGTGTINNDDSTHAVLSVVKSVVGNFSPGEIVTYTLEISNAGPNDQLDNPGDEMTDVLPGQLTYVSAMASSGIVSNVGNTVSWNGAVSAGGTVTVTIDAMINDGVGGDIPNQAEVFYDNDGDNLNEGSALSNPPTGNGPTVFYVGFSIPVPSLSFYGLLIMMGMMLFLLYRKQSIKS
ncbi:beta strand repeat-containing protein [Marinicella litoralis]|uniref:Calx-beta domain-containing protein n=1 Tax=Marinicella litoralis TaxID=644220 RepID=A0A4R6XN57_9GAMM|nr:Calx-beta domain-containing protein [Marinicella litoralis]TDR17558.1 Calx-beta domain-containing protein [Marinicella litoralis]